MKKYLQDKGFKYTDKNDLKHNEFSLLSETETINEELSVLGNVRFETIQTWELYIPLSLYSKEWVDTRFSDILEQNVSAFDFEAIKDEQGYDITLTFTIRGN